MRINLELEGYTVREAASADEALAAIEGQRARPRAARRRDAGDRRLADAAADAGAPRLDPGDHVQRSGRRALGRDAEQRGARGFIGKPFDPQQLIERAKQLVPV